MNKKRMAFVQSVQRSPGFQQKAAEVRSGPLPGCHGIEQEAMALSVALRQFFLSNYPLGPSAAELLTEARTVLALKATCKRLSEHDASAWLWGRSEGEGVRFYIAEAREEAKFANAEGNPDW